MSLISIDVCANIFFVLWPHVIDCCCQSFLKLLMLSNCTVLQGLHPPNLSLRLLIQSLNYKKQSGIYEASV
ncbi:unnamed protein product [Camellia sinensis]